MLDIRSLKPVSSLAAPENPMGGDQGGLTAGTGNYVQGGQQHQTFVDPQGRRVLRVVAPNGHESYAVETASDKAEIYDGSGNKLKDWTKRGALETVLGDKKFMAFVAVATAGAAAGYATGAAGTTGITAGTGATPGTAGAVASSAGAGGFAPALGTAAKVGTAGAALSGAAGGGDDGAAVYGTDGLDNDAGYRAPYGGLNTGTNDLTNINASTLPPETYADIAKRYGGDVMAWAAANPQLASALVGGVVGYAANKDPSTATSTTTTALDPAAQAYRDQALQKIQQYGSSPAAAYRPGGGTPGPANWGGAQPSPQQKVSTANGNTMASIQGGTAADFAPGGRFAQGGATGVTTKAGTPGTMMGAGMSTGAAPSAPMQPGSPYQSAGGMGALGSTAPGNTGGAAPAGSGTPDWGNSNAYMPQVQNYLQQGTRDLTATANPLAGENNPYLTGMIDSAGKDMRQYYDQFIAPKYSSGSSFGSSGLAFAEVAERDRQADNFSSMANNLRFQDYTQRANLLESGASRQDNLNAGGRDNALTAGSTYGQLGQNAGQFNAMHDFDIFQEQNLEQQRRIDALLRGGGMPGGTTVTNNVTSQGNPWAGAAGGIVAGANLWKADSSSPTTKNNMWR